MDEGRESPALGVAPFVAEASRWVSNDDEIIEPFVELSVMSPETRGARVLLVDDSADMRDYVTSVLGRYFVVDQASDGEAALRKLQAHVPDLVLTDVMMPNLDGVGLLHARRRSCSSTTGKRLTWLEA